MFTLGKKNRISEHKEPTFSIRKTERRFQADPVSKANFEKIDTEFATPGDWAKLEEKPSGVSSERSSIVFEVNEPKTSG